MFKKIFLIAIFFASFFLFIPNVFAAQKVDIYFYNAEGCPHCANEEAFFEKLLQDETYKKVVEIHNYEVLSSQKNLDRMKTHLAEFNQQVSGVPMTIIGETVISGFASDDTTGKKIKEAIDALIASETTAEQVGQDKNSDLINLPIIGEINPVNVSLPIITALIGLLDGFNPCAMWALLFLISMLLNMQNRKRMWILGTLFIFTSAVMYFIFMAAWLNLILFIGIIFWVRLLIGIFAVAGGVWNFKKYLNRKDRSGCEVVGTEKRQKTFAKMKEIVYSKNLFWAIIGIVLLAFSVNLVELICSAGLPAVYTQILALNNLLGWQYYGYLILYVFFFMLDDLVIFFIAMITLRATGISTRYSKWSSLIGGIIMVAIGILLIFRPEWLMFG